MTHYTIYIHTESCREIETAETLSEAHRLCEDALTDEDVLQAYAVDANGDLCE